MVIHLLDPMFDPDDDFGPLAPIIRPFFPDPEPDDPDRDRDGGDFDEDEYGPIYERYKKAA